MAYQTTFPSYRNSFVNQTQQKQQTNNQNNLFGGISLPSNNTFNLADTELFKQSKQTAQDFLGGDVPGFDSLATDAREALKTQQALREKQIREGLMNTGLRNTGTYLDQGIIQPENQNLRERTELNRQLASDRSMLGMEAKAQGMTSANDLLELQQTEELENQRLGLDKALGLADIQNTSRELDIKEKLGQSDIDVKREGLALEKELGYADLSIREKALSQDANQFNTKLEFDKWAIDKGYTEAEIERAWQANQNEQNRILEQTLSFADLTFREKALKQEASQFKDKLAFDVWATQEGFTQDEIRRAWQADENDKVLALEKELGYADLTIKEKALIQESSQFTDKQKFDAWALQKGLEENESNRLWQANENEKNREFETTMQNVQNIFDKEGRDFQAVMNYLMLMDPDGAVDILYDTAKNLGYEMKSNEKSYEEESFGTYENPVMTITQNESPTRRVTESQIISPEGNIRVANGQHIKFKTNMAAGRYGEYIIPIGTYIYKDGSFIDKNGKAYPPENYWNEEPKYGKVTTSKK